MSDSTLETIVGIDLGDRFSQTHFLAAGSGETLEQGVLPTTKQGFVARFKGLPRARVALETGTHSVWVSRLLQELGHEVLIANARMVRLITDNDRKNDKLDAERLAVLARADPRLLHPVRVRGEEAQTALVVLKARDRVVRARASLINLVRGLVKSLGDRLPQCGADVFHRKAELHLPDSLRPALEPILAQIASLTATILGYERQIKQIAKEQFPESELIDQVEGVGALTALAYLLTIEDPRRFADGSAVASYLGLVPRQRQSGDCSPQLRITKAGNAFLRRLMVGSAHYILGPFAKDSDLRRWGLKLCERGGKNGKKRAIVAVARKLAVLLHRLWLTGQVYEPLHHANKTKSAQGTSLGACASSAPSREEHSADSEANHDGSAHSPLCTPLGEGSGGQRERRSAPHPAKRRGRGGERVMA